MAVNYLRSLLSYHQVNGYRLAQKIGRSQSYVSLLLNGYQFPTKSEAEIIAKLVDSEVPDIFENVREDRK